MMSKLVKVCEKKKSEGFMDLEEYGRVNREALWQVLRMWMINF